jgi:metallophosphoesterase (TIGR00282 family)
MIRVLMIGDIVGKPGRQAVQALLPDLKADFQADLAIANAENAAGGNGLTASGAMELFSSGVDVLTSGNHIWKQREILDYMPHEQRLLRPANYPPGAPGFGSYFWEHGEKRLAILNLMGRVFMEPLDCPFRCADQEIATLLELTPCILVDFHAEATSEKVAMGWHLDGRVSAVLGTHTHVQTADERILPKGTAYITDIGMSGPFDSVIGVTKGAILSRFLTALPVKFEVASQDIRLSGVKITIDECTGKALTIERFQQPLLR